MGSIDYDPEAVQRIRKKLLGNADTIGRTPLRPTGGFGGSDGGRTLAQDALDAHHHILATLGNISTGLASYAEGLLESGRGIEHTQQDVVAGANAMAVAEGLIKVPFKSARADAVRPGQVTASGQEPIEQDPATDEPEE